jgi:penicillin-binding protein 1C
MYRIPAISIVSYIKKHWQQLLRWSMAAMLLVFYYCLPLPLFDVSYSTVITDRNDLLMGAHTTPDGQWRFPIPDSIPRRFALCITQFEDEYFKYHPGVNPVSMTKALLTNLKSGKTVRGGSTITMQTIRLSRPRPRNHWSKLIEMIQAVRLEFKYSKEEILTLYAAHAPFGGNVVGLEAAAWRYFSRPPHQLSWAETATLAVLPNAPSLIRPDKNSQRLKLKRDKLLQKLLTNHYIDSTEYQLSVEEPLVAKPSVLPNSAPHLLDYFLKSSPGQKHCTTVEQSLQEEAAAIVSRHSNQLRLNQIHHAAALIINNLTGEVLAYIGNSPPDTKLKNGHQVDLTRAARSSGSILKPLLYAASLDDGIILPHTLLPDIPTYYSDFSPQNFNRTFDGAVAADEALSRSLNVPSVRLLDDYGTDRFLALLRKSGLTTLKFPAQHYGLSLILGGAETCLWDLTGVYSSMARSLTHFPLLNGRYLQHHLHPPLITPSGSSESKGSPSQLPPLFSAAAIWHTFRAMTNVQRPAEETGWEEFRSSSRIAWKTGTSFGFRDAWAIGITPGYTVGVWVGNASGEGRPGILGGTAAAPILFDLFRLLPESGWFEIPYDDLEPAIICRQSGYLASPQCDDTDTLQIPRTTNTKPSCPYHSLIHLSADGQFRVSAECYTPSEMLHKSWFVLPPVMEWYYRSKHPTYKPLPPLMDGCMNGHGSTMEFIYPKPHVAVFIPKNLNGETEKLVIKVAHRQSGARIFWHLDDHYLGETVQFHQQEILPTPGWHTITLMDEQGNRISRRFQCVNP